MRNLIIFTTKYGSVRESAEKLSPMLEGDTVIVNLREDTVPDLNEFDTIILGGSVYVGKTQKEISKFAQDNLSTLKQKNIGIYVNSGEPSDKKYDQIKNSFPAELYDKAKAIGLFGDAIYIDKVTKMDKFALRIIKGVKESYNNIDEKAIKDFADKMNS